MIPERLAATAVAWEGERGRTWLAELPTLVADLADAWELEVGDPFEPGGQISWVAPVVCRSDGTAAVLKVQLPHPESDPEAAGLAAWDGDGTVHLLAHDPDRRALLLERCCPGAALADEGGTEVAVRAGARLGARLHRVAAPPGLPTLAEVLDRWADELEGRLVQPYVDPGLGRLAVETMRRLPRACPRPVLLHGDLNPTNVLTARRQPWLAIDPKPMVGDPAYDGPRLITQPDPLATADPAATVARRLALVAGAMEVDLDALAAWTLTGAVEVGASARAHGDRARAERSVQHVRLLQGHQR
ncbi:MAG: aminoglycoside phosphotransferase family protein [Acidimicrobiales bacterium]